MINAPHGEKNNISVKPRLLVVLDTVFSLNLTQNQEELSRNYKWSHFRPSLFLLNLKQVAQISQLDLLYLYPFTLLETVLLVNSKRCKKNSLDLIVLNYFNLASSSRTSGLDHSRPRYANRRNKLNDRPGQGGGHITCEGMICQYYQVRPVSNPIIVF